MSHHVHDLPGADFVWVEVTGTDDHDAVASIAERHGLVYEGLDPMSRPGRWDPDDVHRFALKAVHWDGPGHEATLTRLKVEVGDGIVITTQERTVPGLAIADQMEDPKLIAQGPMAVLLALAEASVRGFEPVVEAIDAEARQAEQEVFGRDRTNSAERLYALKRVAVDTRSVVLPVSERLRELVDDDDRVPAGLRRRVRVLAERARYDDVRVASASDLLSDALQANLAQVSNQQNEDMRVISAWAAVAAVPTLLAGIWGMNFRHMPELDWMLGYPLALGLILAVSGALALFFRKRDWI